MNVKYFQENEVRGTYLIESDTKVILGKNVTISASENVDDYYTDDSIFWDNCGNELGRSLFFANGKSNIEISGDEGSLIYGNGSVWTGDKVHHRPSLIRLVDCQNVTIRNLKLKDSPCWCIHLHNCENVTIENVEIDSWCNGNNDGVDLDCCRNVHVNHCSIISGDDAVVLKSTKNILSENILIENCVIRTRWAGFKIGTETVGDFRNISFCNNKIIDSKGGSLKIVPVDGAIVEKILISNVTIFNGTGPIFIANGHRMRTYFEGEGREIPGYIKDVTIKNVVANVYISSEDIINIGKGVVLASGTKENKIEKLTLKNCFFAMPGGCEEDSSSFALSELTTQYPEFYALGTAPAYGAFFRNIEHVDMENVVFYQKEEDKRKEIIVENVGIFNKEGEKSWKELRVGGRTDGQSNCCD